MTYNYLIYGNIGTRVGDMVASTITNVSA